MSLTSSCVINLKSSIIRGSLGLEVDFISFKKYLSDRFRTEDIFYFTSYFDFLKDNMQTLKDSGYKIILKETFYQNKIKANCDVEISHHITSDIKDDLVKNLVLISGDGDFSMLLDYSLKNNIKPKVISIHKGSTAKILRKKKGLTVEYIFNLDGSVSKIKQG